MMIEKRANEDRRTSDVTHITLLDKLIEHDESIEVALAAINAINIKLDPIAKGISSIAFAFKGLLVLGSGSAATLGIIALVSYLSK